MYPRRAATSRVPNHSSVKGAPTPPKTDLTPVLAAGIGAKDRVHELSLDMGTANLSLSSRITERSGKEKTIHKSDIVEVAFSNGDYKTPQLIAFLDEKLLWGNDVTEALQRGEVEHKNVLEYWKLLLYDEHKDSKTMKMLKKQLKRLKIDVSELITQHLTAVLEYAKAYLSKNHPSAYANEIDRMPVHLYVGVPQMWDPPAVDDLVQAAKGAGFAVVEPVAESISAAAYQIHKHYDALTQMCKVGQTISICDLGGGTGDFLKVKLLSDCNDRARVHLENIGHATGDECGSKSVLDSFEAWLINEAVLKYGSLAAACRALKISEEELLKTASSDFRRSMERFTGPGQRDVRFSIYGDQEANVAAWVIRINSNVMAGFFQTAISDIKRCIDEQGADMILVTGGFGHSQYVREELKTTYEPKHIKVIETFTGEDSERPVSKGSLLRYPAIEGRAFGTSGSFGTALVEEYDQTRHPDAMAEPEKIRVNRVDNRDEVFERWNSLTIQNNPINPGTTYIQKSWQLHIIGPTTKKVSVQLYWTKLHLAEGAPIREGETGKSKLRNGVKLWRKALELTVRSDGQSLKDLGFTPVEYPGAKMYALWTRVEVEAVGADVTARLHLAKSETPPYDANMNEMVGGLKFVEGVKAELQLGEEKFNPFTRPNQ